jgi:outer membrane PBP1 activator LpoA protein
VETNKPEKTIIIDKSTGKTAKKPNLDSFFEQILEEMPENISIQNQEFTAIQSKKALRVAVILPVTGAYSKIGADSLDMVSFLEKKMGEKLQVKVFDTESKKTSIKKISDQINTIDFDVIVGPIFNFETVELASLQPLPIISLSNDKEINKKNVIVFGQNQDDQIKDTITFFAQQDKGNFMALFPNSPNGSRLYKVFKRSMEANKSEIMRVEFYDEDGISDVSRYVNKVINGLVQKTYTSKSDGKIGARPGARPKPGEKGQREDQERQR